MVVLAMIGFWFLWRFGNRTWHWEKRTWAEIQVESKPTVPTTMINSPSYRIVA